MKSAFDLINRLQGELFDKTEQLKTAKAEVERLRKSRDRWRQIAEDFDRITREEERMIENDKE